MIFSTSVHYFLWRQQMQRNVSKDFRTNTFEQFNSRRFYIFVNCLQSEAPLLIRPLIGNMTRSELHAIMTGGFATIAGTVLGAYISFGVC